MTPAVSIIIFLMFWTYCSIKYVAANIWIMPNKKAWYRILLELPCALVIILLTLGHTAFKKLLGKDKQ